MSTPVALSIWTMHPYASIELQSPSDWYLLKMPQYFFQQGIYLQTWVLRRMLHTDGYIFDISIFAS